MQPISLQEAKGRTWDAIVAGTSFAAMFFVRHLPASWSVLLIEKGVLQSHAEQLRHGMRGREEIAQRNSSGHRKEWVAHTIFGGNSNCWWGCTPRFHPNDFRLRTLYGVGEDWPLSYDLLEPLYCEVEDAMEVAGGGSDHLLPRSRPFPYPPHAPSRSDRVLRQHSADWFAQPTARSNGGSRTPCCASGVCQLCPVDAKFTVLNAGSVFERANTHLLLGTELRALDIANGTARRALVRDTGGAEHALGAGLFALGANALFNAAILLRSGLRSPVLGGYLHEQLSLSLDVDVGVPNYFGGTSITGHGYVIYDGPQRRERAAVLIENYNNPLSLRHEPRRWTDRLLLKLIAEDLPQAENRVSLEEGEPVIHWRGHSDYAVRALLQAQEKLQEMLPIPVEKVASRGFAPTEAHIQGTHRMGTDPTRSVVDPALRCHEVRNLLALGAGAFPSCSPANPTLTLSALSIHAARSL